MLNENAKMELAKWYFYQVNSYHSSSDVRIKDHIRRSLSYSWNMLGKHQINQRLVSENAYKESINIVGLNKDIRHMDWDDQVKAVKHGGLGDVGRKIFHWEHAFTRHDFIKKILSEESHLSIKDILDVINEHQIIWILKEENKLINSHRDSDGNRADRCRPNGWRQTYSEVGIILVYDR